MIKLMTYAPKGGGPSIFMKRLTRYMEKHDMVRLVNANPDVYLSTIWGGEVPKGCKWVHRSASVYYNSVDRHRGKGLNQKIAKFLNSADYVIYQSSFAKKLHNKVIKVDPPDFRIIYNGFDVSDYESISPRILDGEKIFVACGNWKKAVKRGEFIIKYFRKAKIKRSHLYMMGDYLDESFPCYDKSYDNVTLLGKCEMKDVISILKTRPYFVHLSYVETCSNAVVEALSYGCPVLCNNIGSTIEIVKNDGISASCDKRFVYKRRPICMSISYYKPLINAFKEITQKTWNITRPDLSMDTCAKEYLQVFKKVLS